MHTVAAAAGEREEEGGQVWTVPSLLYHCTILHQLRNGRDLVVWLQLKSHHNLRAATTGYTCAC